MAAYSADHLALQQIPAARHDFSLPVFPHTSLRFLEQRLRHDGLVPVGDDDPIIAGDFDRVGAAYNVPASFAVYRLSNIPLVPQSFAIPRFAVQKFSSWMLRHGVLVQPASAL